MCQPRVNIILKSWFSWFFYRLKLETRSEAALRHFSSTVGQKWLKNKIAENFKKNMRILRCEEARAQLVQF